MHRGTSPRTGKRGIVKTAKRVGYRGALLVVFLLIVIAIPMKSSGPDVAAAAGATSTAAAVSVQPGRQVQVPVSVDTGGVASIADNDVLNEAPPLRQTAITQSSALESLGVPIPGQVVPSTNMWGEGGLIHGE